MSALPPPKVSAKKVRQGRVLVVDDDHVSRMTLEAILQSDFEVALADNAAGALAILEKRAFDVLVTDFEMPGGTGAELLETACRRWPGMASILLTCHSDYAEVRDLQKTGRVLVLFKPVDPAQLVAWVKNGAIMANLTQATDRMKRSESGKLPRKDEG